MSTFIQKLKSPNGIDKEENRKANLSVLEGDEEWDDDSFNDYLGKAKSTGEELFKSRVE